MSELPSGWAPSSVGDLLANGFFSDGDWVESKDQDPQGSIRLLQLADIGEGHFRDRSSRFINQDAAERLNVNFVEPGDVLVARMPDPIGRACLAPSLGQRAITVVDVCILRADPGVEPRWLMWALNSPSIRQAIAALATGTTRKRISRKNLATIGLAVPPLPEQRRIVAAIEEHFSRLDAAEAGLRRSRALTAVLDESAFEALIEKDWPAASIGEVAKVGSGSTPSRSESRYWEGGNIPWVSSAAVNRQRITEPSALITHDALAETSVKLWPPGTVLVAMYGEGKTRGKAAVLEIEATCNQACAAIVPGESVNAEYLRMVLTSQYAQNRKLASGGVQPNLNLGLIREMQVPLPEVSIQQQVVDLAANYADLITRLKESVIHADRRSAALRRSILAAAFSGKLVPQDPSDEPASVLLEGIAAERPASKASRRKAKAPS